MGKGLLLACIAVTGFAQTLPRITGVVNTAGQTTLSPGAYGVARGTGFGTSPKVFLNGTPCTMFAVSDLVAFFLIPKNTPLGQVAVTVQGAAATSAPVNITLTAASPAILLNVAKPPVSYFFDLTPVFTAYPTPSPGDRVYIYIDGINSAEAVAALQVLIDDKPVPVLGVSIFRTNVGSVTTPGDLQAVNIQIPNVPGGPHTLRSTSLGVASNAVPFTIIASGLVLSQTGLTINAVQGGPTPPFQTFGVLSGAGTINFSVTASTVSGGSWLNVTPGNGSVTALAGASQIQVRANPTGLSAGTYYGKVEVASPDVPNSPQAVTVVLVVGAATGRAGPYLDKTGLIFTASPGGTAPQAQVASAFNPGLATLTMTSSLSGPGSSAFRLTPATGPVLSGQNFAITATPAITNLPAGIYTSKGTITFSDGTARVLNLLMVIAPGATPSGRNADPACTPTKLLPVFTLLGDSFSIPAAWPTPVEVTTVDDCGSSVSTGIENLTFSNGDPPLRLASNGNGKWSATWPPSNPRASDLAITVTATQPERTLTGSAQVSGGVSANPAVPEISPGGVVETASYAAPAAPGNLIAIFGTKLAPGVAQATAVPLPQELGTVAVLMGGKPIPLYFTSDGQLVAVAPYDLATNTRHQMIVQRGNAISVPQSVQLGVARPAIFTLDASGQGQGHIYKIDASGAQILANRANPAKAGDVLVIYCSGLGAVNPPLTAGTATPLAFLTSTVDRLTATIAGRPATVSFSGLTPGSTALYQVNLVVPAGVPDGDGVPVVLTISGQDSVGATLSIRN